MLATNPLVIAIGMNITAASRALKQLESELGGVGKTMNAASSGASKAHESVKSFGSALEDIGKVSIGFAVGNAFANFIEDLPAKVGEAINQITDLGQATYTLQQLVGGTTESASGLLAVFERFGVSSEQAGVSLGIFSKHLAGIEDLSEGAATGSKTFNQTMRDLGVSFTSASGQALPMNTVLLSVADRFQELGPGADRTAIALQLFGRSGKDLIPVLSLGAEGMQEAEEAAAKYGLTLSGSNVKAIRDYGFAHKDLDEAMTGVAVTMGNALLPAMTSVAQSAALGAQTINQDLIPAIHHLGETPPGRLVQDFEDLAKAAHEVDIAVRAVTGVNPSTPKAPPPLGIKIDGLPDMLGNLLLAANPLTASLFAVHLAGEAARETFRITRDPVQHLGDTMASVAEQTKLAADATMQMHDPVQHLGDTMGNVAGTAAELANKLIEDRKAMVDFNAQVAVMRASAADEMARDPNAGRPVFNLEGPSSSAARANTEQGLLQSNLAKTEAAAIKAGNAAATAFDPFAAALSVIDAKIAGIQLGPLEKQLARLEKRPIDPNRPTSQLPVLEVERRILQLKQTVAAGGLGGGGNTYHNTVTVTTGPITGNGDAAVVADKILDALLASGKSTNTAAKTLPGA